MLTTPTCDSGETAPIDSIVDLTRTLVSIPSRAGVDDYGPVFRRLKTWLSKRGVPHRQVDGTTPCLIVDVAGTALQRYLFNATLDTASFGDEQRWSHPPTSAEIESGWLYGRGAADSKVAVAIFCHLALALTASPRPRTAGIIFAFDADEHTGGFGGMRRCLDAVGSSMIGGAIGYPGDDRLLVGSRGVWRARIQVHGNGGHSGSTRPSGANAVARAAVLVRTLEERSASLPISPGFPLGPRLTVTGITGGGDFSVVPDLCAVDVDVRLTPTFEASEAEALVRACIDVVDRGAPGVQACRLEAKGGWPAYQVSADSNVVKALRDGALAILGRPVPLDVAGPSNIGNFLATRGIPMTCGFGVRYRNIHAVDECIEIASISPIYKTYLRAIELLTT
jgi:succinyl-diaminopimelate desuccinylase